MVAVLRTENLSKRFGKIRAVRGVGIEIAEGDIYGFLGVNGAGKTTTIRMILRLIRPDAGRVEVFGKEVRGHFIEIMRRVGSLVETPAYYPHLSAAKNLEILRLINGGIHRSRIDEVLGQVNLLERRHSRVRTYSQGMRQRLAIAMALLPRPDFMILDEPMNGLDPQGISDMRTLIRRLNRDHGITFLFSSHQLHEVEITCNRVGIIRDGELVVQEKVETLLRRAVPSVRIGCARPAEALEKIRALDYVREAETEGDAIRASLEPGDFARLNADLVAAGVEVSAFTPVRLTLEEFFLTHRTP
ncbi:MAG: ABC transporter ATP-binding protein [Planctomycetota bacterium]|jgi:ABC-2 type transport system ATP-binding protein